MIDIMLFTEKYRMALDLWQYSMDMKIWLIWDIQEQTNTYHVSSKTKSTHNRFTVGLRSRYISRNMFADQ